MSARRTHAVALRVLRQIGRDRRFVVLVVVAPMLLVFFIKTLFDATSVPTPDADPLRRAVRGLPRPFRHVHPHRDRPRP